MLLRNYENFKHIIIYGDSTDSIINILNYFPLLKWISESDKVQIGIQNKVIPVVANRNDTIPSILDHGETRFISS